MDHYQHLVLCVVRAYEGETIGVIAVGNPPDFQGIFQGIYSKLSEALSGVRAFFHYVT
ncbi:hypothetical protein D3C76_1845140 [compost metagenome]